VNAAPARWALLFLAVAALGACQRKVARAPAPVDDSPAPVVRRDGPASALEQDGGPAIPPDVSRVPEPVPHTEPLAAYGNKSPYTVLGRTYRVLPTSRGYAERGMASWYGTKFHGRLTSSREPYDMFQMTAAHKTLPLPSYVRVTNLENRRSAIVRVNDRGPFHAGRIIDLSYAAAIKLGVHANGTARVEVVAIDAGAPELAARPAVEAPRRPAPAAPGPAARGKPVYLQVGAFDRRDNARRVEDRLEDAGIEDVFLDQVITTSGLLHRVRVGPLRDVAEAAAVGDRLRQLGVSSIQVFGN
jgi:rare lipoprotein A